MGRMMVCILRMENGILWNKWMEEIRKCRKTKKKQKNTRINLSNKNKMRKIILLAFVLIAALNIQAQTAKNTLTVFTKDTLAEFRLFVNGDQKNNFHVDSITVSDIDSNMVNITVNFKYTKFSDKTEEVSFIETNNRVYEIVAKKRFFKAMARLGRGFGRMLKIGNHENDEELSDDFYLKDRTVLYQYK
jgi:hypothetical protein